MDYDVIYNIEENKVNSEERGKERAGAARQRHPQGAHVLFLAIVGVVFVALMIVFLFFPRPAFSELEKRALAKFPDLSEYSGKINQYPSDISSWFSDSEPFRDKFLAASMSLRGAMGMHFGNPEEAVSFKAVEASEEAVSGFAAEEENLDAAGNPLADANAKKANRGVIVVGSGQNVRAISSFGGTPAMGDRFIKVINDYVTTLPGVTIHALPIPTAAEFYLPEKAKSMCKPQKPVLDYIQQRLPAGARFVDAYTYLAAHTHDPIYLRTDHHWSPLGGFYAAKAIAKSANVPFKELDSYDSHVIHGYVGSMYAFSKDIALKNAPEDFVYYTPKGLNYQTTYVTYKTNDQHRAVSASAPYQGEFFKKYPDGSSSAYLTFMGGDTHLVKVSTGTPSARKVLIIKDSFGNAIPGYLFYSFGEVHVVDFRYFTGNLANYVKRNGITDVVLAFNIFNVVSGATPQRISELLHQKEGSVASPSVSQPAKDSPAKESKEKAKPANSAASDKESAKKPAAAATEQSESSPKAEPKAEHGAQQAPAPQPEAVPSE